MLKKYIAIGFLAAFTMIPSAVFAGNQTQGDSGNNNINATNIGKRNRIRIINKTYVIQSQRRGRRFQKRYCRSLNNQAQNSQNQGNQTQGNVINNRITATNQGNRNRIKITNINNVFQNQEIDCSRWQK